MAGIARRATVQIPVEMEGLEKLKDLNSTLDRITQRSSSFRKSFADTSRQLSEFNDKAQEFGKRYSDMMKDASSSNRDFTKSNREMANQVNQGQKDMQNSLARTREAQERLNNTSTNTTDTVSRGHERMGRSIDTHNSKLSSLNHTSHSLMMNGMNISMAFTGLTGLFYKGAKGAQQLQQEYRIIYNLATYGGEKASEAQSNVNKMQRQGAQISKQYGISQTDVSEGAETLLRRGYTTNEVLGSQKEYVRGAIASHDDYKDVIQSASNALDQFNLRTNNPQKMQQNTKTVLNQMTYGADQTAAGYKDMGYAMSYVGTIASQSHQSLAQTSADIGELSNRGLEGSKAGTGMRRVLEGLSKPKTKVLKNIGLSPQDLQDSHGNLKSVQDDMEIINQHSKDLSSTQRVNLFQSLFGTTGYHAGLILANNDDKVKSLNQHIEQSQNMGRNHQGYNAIIAQKNMDTFQQQAKRMLQAFNAFTQSVVQQMLPSLTKWAKRLNGIFSAMSNMSDSQKKWTGWTVAIVGAIGPVSLALGGLIKAFASVGKSLSWLRRQMASPMPSTATDSIGRQATENAVSSSEMNPSVGTIGKSRNTGSFLQRNSSLFGRSARETSHMPHVSYAKDLSYGREGPEALSDMSKGASAIGKYGRSGGASRGLLTRGLGATRSISSKIPYLDLAASAVPLIGMNHKNAGSRVGNATGTFGGMEAGAAAGAGLGSIIPGAGTVTGGLLGAGGGALGGMLGGKGGSKLGSTLQKHFPSMFSTISKDARSAGNAITGAFHKMGNTVMPEFHRMTKAFHNFENQWTHSTVGKVIDKYFIRQISNLGNTIADFSKISYHTIAGLLKWIWNSTKDIFSGLGGVIKGGLKTFRGLFETVGDAVTGNWKGMFKGLEDMFWGFVHIFGSIGNVLKGIVTNSMNGFQSTIENFSKWLVQKVSNIGQFFRHPLKTIEGKMPNQSLPESNGTVPTSQHARDMSEAGIPKSQQKQYNAIIEKESSWNTHAQNGSGAYGLPQSLPSQKLLDSTSDGKNPKSNPVTQLRWMRKYINGTYGNAATALNTENTKHGYGNGGWSSSPAIFGELSGQPEVAINPAKDSADTLIQQAIQARSKYHKSQADKSSVSNLQGNISEMMNNKNKGKSSKPIEVTQNFTINGNTDKNTVNHLSQTTKRAVKQVIDEYFGEKNDAIFNS